ncbi:MAG: riboflavin synthase [Nitrososphaeraceae archaeon]|jgi:riboflavin synthase
MFTGIIEGIGEVKSASKFKDKNKAASMRLSIYLGKIYKGLKVGNSVSINGTCLTITKLCKRRTADFEIVGETIKRTCLGLVRPGDKVNIERSLRVGERLEGHIVLGHVDATGTIKEIITSTIETKIWIKIEKREVLRSIVSKGSIAIDGVSLTVVDIKDDKVSISLIPHTLANTTLGLKSNGDKVNVEIDIIGKYIINNLPKS